MIITIDGLAGTGKSTVAKRLAGLLGITYFDTGALYRAISWKILEEKVPLSDLNAIEALLKDFHFHIQILEGEKHYFVGESDVTEAIRTVGLTQIVSEVSALEMVREALKPIQVAYAQETDVVFEGRDLGTVIFPQADVKFFLTARDEVRAQRRFDELKNRFGQKKGELSFEKVLEEIRKRDCFDASRKVAPLKKATDAIVIDTSDYSVEEVVFAMKAHVKKL